MATIRCATIASFTRSPGLAACSELQRTGFVSRRLSGGCVRNGSLLRSERGIREEQLKLSIAAHRDGAGFREQGREDASCVKHWDAQKDSDGQVMSLKERCFGGFVPTFLAVSLGAGILLGVDCDVAHAVSMAGRESVSLDTDMTALALGEPLVEEFWDNMRRYVLYFFTVATGGLASILGPFVRLLQNPVTAVLVVLVLGVGLSVMYLTLSAMLGAANFSYQYSVYDS